MHVYCSYSGGVPRAFYSSPLRTIGPAQSAEGEWPGGRWSWGEEFVGFVKGEEPVV